ncbi:MAG: hypothetical protein Q8N99_04220 [Nanoarchaeota archaeon]|nr:hypothetical protein [Nanoarchaeota archaeon]
MYRSNPFLLTEEDLERVRTPVLDESSAYAIEVHLLEEIVNKSITETGKVLVQTRLLNPLTSLREIKRRQDSLREIRSNDKLKQALIDFLSRVKEHEEKTSEFVKGSFYACSEVYDVQADARSTIQQIPKWALDIPQPQSEYLAELKKALTDLKKSPTRGLVSGPLFHQWFRGGEVLAWNELKPYIPAFPFVPFPIKLSRVIPSVAVGAAFGIAAYSDAMSKGKPEEMTMGGIMALLGSMAGAKIGNMWGQSADCKLFLKPLSRRLQNDEIAQNSFLAIGCLDELVAYDEFGKGLKVSTLPEVYASPKHEFYSEGLINPVQSKTIPNYVPNDVHLSNGQRLTFFTGPNSGGKTSLGKSIAQTQLLSQIGCYVSAVNARVSLADNIFYQIGKGDSLEDSEGGLGAQLGQTRNIFRTCSPQSLVIVDDLIEGTTFKEKTEQTRDALYGFLHKGTNIIYITHHYELAQEFQENGVGRFLQVEFNGTLPTHRFIPGISTNSHADIVAKRVGFDKASMEQHLRENRYLTEEQSFEDISRYKYKC